MIVGRGDFITGVRLCLEIDIEYSMGGHTETVNLGEIVHIETRFKKSYTGYLINYEKSEKECMQDCFVIKNQEGKEYRVGIHDIVMMEDANGRMD